MPTTVNSLLTVAVTLQCPSRLMVITKNNSYLFHMNLHEAKLYIKIVALDEIYNFVLEKFMN